MMDDANTSVDAQLKQIEAKLGEQALSSSGFAEPTQVVSATGFQEGEVRASPATPSPPRAPSTVEHAAQSAADDSLPVDQAEDRLQPLPMPEPLAQAQAVEPPMIDRAVALTPSASTPSLPFAQVLGVFSDSWVTEMAQRVETLREEITLVHDKLDQFSPR